MANAHGGIDEDGIWGPETTRAAQRVWGAPINGRVIHQIRSQKQDGEGNGWEFDGVPEDSGDRLIRLLQEFYHLDHPEVGVNGHADLPLIREFIRRMQQGSDGVVTFRDAVLEFQRRINTGDAAGI